MVFPLDNCPDPAELSACSDPLASSGLVIVDKPAGLTSHDCVGRLRRLFRTKKVGHAGTLDPLATGVLVLGLERGTKFLAHMVAEEKSYDATIRLGAATTTDDLEGEVTQRADRDALGRITDSAIEREVNALTGEIMQRPARVSAIKINGERAHRLVRRGEEVDIPARPVTIHEFVIHSITRVENTAAIDANEGSGVAPAIDVRCSVRCSSGTYIRSLARDLGEALEVGGHLTALRRTQVGPFGLEHSRTLERLENTPQLSLSLDQALVACYPPLAVTKKEAAALAMGQWLEPRGVGGVHAAVDPDGRAVALVQERGTRLATVFVARPSTLAG